VQFFAIFLQQVFPFFRHCEGAARSNPESRESLDCFGLRPCNDDRDGIALSLHFPTSVITPFQLRYETVIRNDDPPRIASSLLRSHTLR
jgi:hypothetical protein